MSWQILGIHGKDVVSVPGDVARVRMFFEGGLMVDEDFPLPTLPPGVPPLESVYGAMLAPTIDVRFADLAKHVAAGADLVEDRIVGEGALVHRAPE